MTHDELKARLDDIETRWFHAFRKGFPPIDSEEQPLAKRLEILEAKVDFLIEQIQGLSDRDEMQRRIG